MSTNRTIFSVRIFFFITCIIGSWLVCFSIPEWDRYQGLALFMGASLGGLVILVDIFLKGFSLRGLTAISFGMGMGLLIAYLLDTSPLFENGDEAYLFLVRLALYLICMYLGTVVALRGKDEFNLVIPYVRFAPQEVESTSILLDTSALIDGRIVKLVESRFICGSVVIPQFVLNELQGVADSSDSTRKEKGRRGLDHLNKLRRIPWAEIKIHDSEVDKEEAVDSKLLFLAKSMQAKLLTLDYNLARLAEFQGIVWLNLNDLHNALAPEVRVGDEIPVELVKPGKDAQQAVGYMSDGSMMVVNDGKDYIGSKILAEVISILPSSGGKMVFAKVLRSIEEE